MSSSNFYILLYDPLTKEVTYGYIPGAQGWQGSQGTVGVQGIDGFQGFQGFEGVVGFQGHEGNQGNQGNQGLVGVQGAVGGGVTGTAGAIQYNSGSDTFAGSTNLVYTSGTNTFAFGEGNSGGSFKIVGAMIQGLSGTVPPSSGARLGYIGTGRHIDLFAGVSVANSATIDMHSLANVNNDYDFRIESRSGVNGTNGRGNVTYTAARHSFTTESSVSPADQHFQIGNFDSVNSRYTVLSGLIFNNNTMITGNPTVRINNAWRLGIESSSIRFKRDIQPYRRGINELMMLEPVTYLSAQDLEETRRGVGFIAEKLHEDGLTEFVAYEKDTTVPIALEYDKIVVLAVSAIKDLKATIDTQNATIDAQNATIDALRSEIATIKSHLGVS